MNSLLIAAVALLAITGAPLFVVILAASMVGFYLTDTPLTAIGINLYQTTDTPLLLSLPLFTMAGYLLAESKTSERLVRVSQALIGSLPGGLAIIALVTCALFTAFTGASGVTIVAIGALLYPALKRVGYSDKFSLGLVTSSGSLGLLLAPSLPLILYGIIAQQMDVGESFTMQQLFLAGIMPAGLMILTLTAYSLWSQRHSPIQRQRFSAKELGAALKEARWELPLPFIVLFGIYGGYFAVSETAAVTLAYVLVAEVLIYREVRPGQLPRVVLDAITMVGGIVLILACAQALTNVLIDAQVPDQLFNLIKDHVDSKLGFLILLNILLLILGCLLDIFSATVIMVPLLLPVAVAYGIHPIHLGIIFLANMQIGYFTPPVGMNLFIASYRFKKPIIELYQATVPFMVVLLLALAIITYVPWLSLGLIHLGQ